VEVARDNVNIVLRIDPYPGDADPEKKSWPLCRGREHAALRNTLLTRGLQHQLKHVQQKRQDGSAFALAYILRRRSCRLMGVFVIAPLPPMLSKALQTVGSLRSTGITPLHHYYGPLRHPLIFSRFLGVAGYTTYLPSSDLGDAGTRYLYTVEARGALCAGDSSACRLAGCGIETYSPWPN
jgi:hypothetical protein